MSRAAYKIYSQADFQLEKSWELIDQYIESEKANSTSALRNNKSTLNEFKGVMYFIHQTEKIQDIFSEACFKNGIAEGGEYTDFELKDLTRADILTYINYLNSTTSRFGELLTPSSKKTKYCQVNAFLSWVEDEFEESFENPCIATKRAVKDFKKCGSKPKRSKYIPFEKLAEMHYLTEHNYELDVFAMFLLFVHSAPRVGELMATKRASVAFNAEYNYFESTGKTGPCLYFFPPEVARVLRSYLKWLDVTYPNSEFLFPAIQNPNEHRGEGWAFSRLGEIREKIDFHFSSHWFRHTLITNRLHAKGACKERCPKSVSEKLQNHAPTGTEAKYYDQLVRSKLFDNDPDYLDPVEEIKHDYKDYLRYHPYNNVYLSFQPKKEEN